MQKRNVINSPRLQELKKRRRRTFLNKILLSALALLVVFGCLVYIFRIPSLNISDVEVKGNEVTDTGLITESVNEVIGGKYLWLLPKTNILFYPKGSIKKQLSDKFKRLKEVNLSVKSNRILEVSVAERQATYTWCGAAAPSVSAPGEVNSNEKCYFMDQDGYIFDEAPYFSGNVYFKFYGLTDIPLENPSGFYFAPENFSKIISFKETLSTMGIKPVSLSIEENGDAKINLSSGGSLSTGPEIIFDPDSDLEKTAENLEAALTTEPLQSSFKNKYSSLMYIDLRYDNKVYFK